MLGLVGSSTRRHFLQRDLNQFFRRFCFAFLLEVAHCFMRIDLFVAKRDQCEHGLVGLLLPRA